MGDVPLRVVISSDVHDFLTGSTNAQSSAAKLREAVENLGASWTRVSKQLSVGLSLPLVGLAAMAVKTAAGFETAMNRVQIATGAAGDAMAQMQKQALDIGGRTTKSASEAAEAMEVLAKAGMDMETIMAGGAAAAVDLSEATGSALDPAAAAITDTLTQFRLSAGQLPEVVNNITGAVNESKLDFADFQLAMGQAGGVAGGLGVTFRDFTGVLAGTSAMFASGSDAGTSFKTFLSSLVPKSKEAAEAMRKYGLRFFDANGAMLGMGEIAEILRVRLAKLDDETRNDVLSTIFGSDAIRTALGLMRLGADGLDDIQRKIAATDAAAQSAARMGGLAGQLEQLRGALEKLAITVANSGLIQLVTRVVTWMANMVESLASAHPWLLKLAVAVGVFAAALGPLMMVVGVLASTLLPIFAAKLSPIALALSAMINPLATVIGLLGRFVLGLGGMSILGTIGPMLLRVLGPIGLVVSAFLLFRDQVAPVLTRLRELLESALGPAVQGLMISFRNLVGALANVFQQLMSGPAGDAIRWLIDACGQLVAKLLELAGTVVIKALAQFAISVKTIFDVIAASVRGVTKLIRGDFIGAIDEAKRAADAMRGGVSESVDMWAGRTGAGGGGFGSKPRGPYSRNSPAGPISVPPIVPSESSDTGKKKAETDAFTSAWEGLRAQLFPLAEAMRTAVKNEELLAEAFRRGKITAADYAVALDMVRASANGLADAAASSFQEVAQKISQEAATPISAIKVNIDELGAAAKKAGKEWAKSFEGAEEFAKNISRNLAQAIVYGQDIGTALVNSFKAAAAEAIANGLFELLLGKNGSGGILSNLISGIGAAFGGAYADGGRPPRGRISVVGEKGPELFVPDSTGTIIPNHALGGGGTVINVDARGATDPAAVERHALAAFLAARNYTDRAFDQQARPRLARGAAA